MDKKEPVIVVNNVGKCYKIYNKPKDRLKQVLTLDKRKFYNEFWALRDVNFTVGRGETIGIIGRNGSGKSTLLQMIAGTLQPTKGEINVNGRVAALLELGSGFNPEFTGRDNVFLNGSILGISHSEMEKRYNDIVEFADIGDFIDQPVKLYSSGMFVRLAFAVQALIEPDILIVDEALSVGDEKFQRKCFSYIEKLRKNGTSILIVSHSTAMIEKFTSKCLLLEKGYQHGFGLSKDIIDQYRALLYADEVAYMKMVNRDSIKKEVENKNQGFMNVNSAKEENSNDGKQIGMIEDVWSYNTNLEETELFLRDDIIEIGFKVRFLEDIPQVQAGIRIKTVEGVEVFGVSTEHFNKSPKSIKKGALYSFKFKMHLSLCEGTYFISVAIAQRLSVAEMLYIDKRSDVLIIKVKENKITGTGIANLNANITYQVED